MLSRPTRLSIFFITALLVQAAAPAADNNAPAAVGPVPASECSTGGAIQAGGGPPSPPASDLPTLPISPTMTAQAMTAALDAYLSGLAANGNFSGTVLVAKSGEALFEHGYGLANVESNRPNTAETRFNIGSIGKLFTQVAICQLVEKGKLKLTDTLGDLLPDYPNAAARPATVQQLLDHTAGIANFFSPEFAAADKSKFRSNDDYYRFVAPRPLTAAPGERREYCNGCYVVLGAIVARVSGMPYETYIAGNVFKPAGATGAGFVGSGDDRVATGYTRGPEGGPLMDNHDLLGAHGSGAGGAYARARDLLAIDNALREFRLLDRPMTGAVLHTKPGATATGARMVGGKFGVAGGAPGVNAMLISNGTWTVVVEGNRDIPNAQRVGMAIAQQLMP